MWLGCLPLVTLHKLIAMGLAVRFSISSYMDDMGLDFGCLFIIDLSPIANSK